MGTGRQAQTGSSRLLLPLFDSRPGATGLLTPRALIAPRSAKADLTAISALISQVNSKTGVADEKKVEKESQPTGYGTSRVGFSKQTRLINWRVFDEKGNHRF